MQRVLALLAILSPCPALVVILSASRPFIVIPSPSAAFVVILRKVAAATDRRIPEFSLRLALRPSLLFS